MDVICFISLVEVKVGVAPGHGILLCLPVRGHGLLQRPRVLGDVEEVGKVGVAQDGPAQPVGGVQLDGLAWK